MDLKDFILKDQRNQDLIEKLRNRNVKQEQLDAINQANNLQDKIIAILKTISDPEMSINVWDLGLIYNLNIDENAKEIYIEMTLTAPTCPIAELIPAEVKNRISQFITNMNKIEVELVWDPAWSKEMMSEDAKLLLDLW